MSLRSLAAGRMSRSPYNLVPRCKAGVVVTNADSGGNLDVGTEALGPLGLDLGHRG